LRQTLPARNYVSLMPFPDPKMSFSIAMAA
jgi:hypothetical protein